MDSKFYGMPYYIDEIDTRLKKMTVAEVNAAIKKYLNDGQLRRRVRHRQRPAAQGHPPEGRPEPEDLQRPGRRPEVLEADKTIQALKVQPTKIEIVPVAQVFEK